METNKQKLIDLIRIAYDMSLDKMRGGYPLYANFSDLYDDLEIDIDLFIEECCTNSAEKI